MKFADFIHKTAIIKNLKSKDKKEGIKEMVECIKNAYKLTSPKITDIVESLMKRETVGSTGIGGGVAVPHAKIPGLKNIIGSFGRSAAGINFNAIDGGPVHLVFVILAPPEQESDYLQALRRVSQSIQQANFCRFLTESKDIKSIIDIFNEYDETVRC
ncbi:MAG: PTS sugar transporter subunit IIA [Planctomycetota bacterium]